MDITILFLILITILFFAAFFQEIFPQCGCCRYYKPRPFFRLHKHVSFFESIHVCKKCCLKYGIYSLKDYRNYEKIKSRAELDLFSVNSFESKSNEKKVKNTRRKKTE